MVKIISGDLLNATENVICHQVNCQGVMGSGVARCIREKWPNVYLTYKAACYEQGSVGLLGHVCYAENGHHQVVANMFAQNLYGYDGNRYTSYDAFYKCLEDIRITMPEHLSIAFPYKVGSDRGGASWDVIYAMICNVLGDRDVTIYKLEDA